MAVTRPVFLDTSVLLAGLIDMGPSCASAQGVMAAVADRRIRRPRTAWHCCLEFYSVSTRLPPELRLRPEDAARLVTEEILGRLDVHDLPPGRRLPFLRQATEEQVAGGRVYDAHISWVALAADTAIVVTDNRRHFIGLQRHGVRVLTAQEFRQELES